MTLSDSESRLETRKLKIPDLNAYPASKIAGGGGGGDLAKSGALSVWLRKQLTCHTSAFAA